MRVLYVEPFDAGSHRAFGDALEAHGGCSWLRWSLPGRHWKWRMRGAGLWFAAQAPDLDREVPDVLLASSFTPLADLVALLPALARVPKVLYFHEDQWSYPERPDEQGAAGRRAARDHHYGMTQLVSAAVADRCWFNSAHCRDAFIDGSAEFLRRMPDARPPGLVERIAARSEVVGFPMTLPARRGEQLQDLAAGADRAAGPIVLWNHRWEHDKAPESFFAACDQLAERGVPFRLAVCGERYRESPAVFEQARRSHEGRIVHWGHLTSRSEYLELLDRAQIVVSTARHEFFGVAVLEAVHCGAYPVLPRRLAYPEHFGDEFLYADVTQLVETLERLCREWAAGERDLRADRTALTAPHAAECVTPRLVDRLRQLGAGEGPSASGASQSG